MNGLIPFQYKRLDLSSDEIRLIRLHPSSQKSVPPKCEIIHTCLSENPQYDAVSYTWGSESTVKRIAIENQWGRRFLNVRPNLFSALSCLREPETRLLWIDAICINQKDGNERNHQVAQMGRIYAQARTVLIWLGEFEAYGRGAEDLLYSVDNLTIGKIIAKINEEGEGEVHEHEEGWTQLAGLCFQSYWRRLWIIQEIALAKRVTLHWGKYFSPWEKFVALCTILDDLKVGGYRWEIKSSNAARFARQFRGNVTSHTSPDFTRKFDLEPLLNLVLSHQSAECSDPRDKVYGLLSLASTCCQDGVIVDYTKSASEVCEDVLRHHFSQPHWPERNQTETARVLHGVVYNTPQHDHSILNEFPYNRFRQNLIDDEPNHREDDIESSKFKSTLSKLLKWPKNKAITESKQGTGAG